MPATKPKRIPPTWLIGNLVVRAYTKGEARAAYKRLHNLPRVPVGMQVHRLHPAP